ncbi:PAS domain S-box-containing protein [Deinococcus metalli]|uniref:histidine kinase n=1 Tax=Deinococcus metalli TaxID=1141878 RepID=A0A7W8KHI7_9DEIO|nr:ATP-binding protein [Deinococcus metalli]MBB5376634.1 PAS domain S-box-containing protein [Deinococcus metalli]GHF42627.1 hypothetical protein GCM10017781_18680 [Deinococcus metalli]
MSARPAVPPPPLVTLSEATDTPMLLIGRDGHVWHANAAAGRALVTDPQTLHGRPLHRVLPGLDLVEGAGVVPGPVSWTDPVGGASVNATVVQLDGWSAVTWRDSAYDTLLAATWASEARYRALTEATRQYVWTNSPEGEMRGEQPGWAALTGQSPAEYQGFGWSDRVHPDDRDHAVRAWNDAVARRDRYEVEQRVQVGDGTYRHFLVCGVPLLHDDGRIREWVGLHSDVTELRRAEQELRRWNEDLDRRVADSTRALREANAELDAFSYSVSHDLRAPVRHVLGFTQLLRRRAQDKLDPAEQTLLGRVETAAQHMGSLIDGLLSFAKLSQAPLKTAEVPLDQLVDEVRTALHPEHEDRDVEWQVAPLPAVRGDRQLLKFALINVLSNALKYTSTRNVARIEVGATQHDGAVTLWVRDNGVGFDERYADQLFRVFQRLHHADEFEGLGIGLATVARIVTRHGGRVWAEGAVDRGATFYLGLPGA